MAVVELIGMLAADGNRTHHAVAQLERNAHERFDPGHAGCAAPTRRQLRVGDDDRLKMGTHRLKQRDRIDRQRLPWNRKLRVEIFGLAVGASP